MSQMIVVGAEHHGLIPENRIAAGKDPDHIPAHQCAGVGLTRGGGVPADSKRLEPASGRGLQPYLGKAAGQIRGG